MDKRKIKNYHSFKGENMKKILTIAGSDSIGGAGIQADIKTITALKCYAMSAITALTAQNTTGVFGVSEVAVAFVGAQIDAIFSDITPDATKIGMVWGEELIEIIAQKLRFYGAKNIVADPVMVATSGGVLLKQSAITALEKVLLPIAKVITPNIYEAEILSNLPVKNVENMREAGLKIYEKIGCAVLVKGGHLLNEAVDILVDNGEIFEFNGTKIETENSHGTGCTLSSAIACALGNGLEMLAAVEFAKDFVAKALSWNEQIGHAHGSIDHYFRIPSAF